MLLYYNSFYICFCFLLQLNAFSSQIDEKIGCISQATEKDVTTKLLKRLRNLVYVHSTLIPSKLLNVLLCFTLLFQMLLAVIRPILDEILMKIILGKTDSWKAY